MVGDLGGSTGASTLPGAPALRVTRPGWRDPRLWVGLLLVTGSVVLGARLLAAADDAVQVWAAASDLAAGTSVTDADLIAVRVRFADDDDLARYLEIDEPLSQDGRLTRAVAAGDLVPRSALGTDQDTGLVELPIAVDPEQVPSSVGPGSIVDVHVVATPRDQGEGRSQPIPSGPILSAVSVLEAPSIDAGFGTTGRRQLVLAVTDEDVAAFFALLGSVDQPVLTIVRRG